MGNDTPIQTCADEPCADCPWRHKNAGRRSKVLVAGEKYGWFSAKNRSRLWAKLRRGDQMTCHPTDPRHPGVPENAKTKECAGALILQQREVMIVDRLISKKGRKEAWSIYRSFRPSGMTMDGVLSIIERFMFGGTPLGGVKPGTPNLNNAEVGHPKLPWPPECVEVGPLELDE